MVTISADQPSGIASTVNFCATKTRANRKPKAAKTSPSSEVIRRGKIEKFVAIFDHREMDLSKP
jgi:hypothetical protein